MDKQDARKYTAFEGHVFSLSVVQHTKEEMKFMFRRKSFDSTVKDKVWVVEKMTYILCSN